LKKNVTPPATVKPPHWLSGPAVQAWDELKTAANVVLEPGDIPAFSLLSELYATFQSDPAGFGPSNTAQLRLLMGEYGLTPSSKARRPATQENPFASVHARRRNCL